MPNNQSLDRVREKISIQCTLYANSLKNSDKSGMVVALDSLETLINSELQNLRQELASEVEGLKKTHYQQETERTKREKAHYNQAIDKVLAIIKRDKGE